MATKKKKKKKPKKKKKATGDTPSSPSVASLAESMSSTTISSPQLPSSPPKKGGGPAQQTSPKAASTRPSSSFLASTTSLPIGETIAQSGHSYLQSSQVAKVEKKLKSRPDHASLFGGTDKKSGGLFARLLSRDKDATSEMKSAKQSWFARLGKRTNKLMHQLLRTTGEARGSMKWEDFVKVSQ